MLKNIAKADQLLTILRSHLPIKEEDRQRLDKKFRLEFSFNSNNIEGNTLTYGETELLLIFGETKGETSHQYRDYEEMKGHDVAFELVKEYAADKERPLAESFIKNLNQVILVEPFWKEAITPDGQNTRRKIAVGNYKQYPNSVRLPNGEIFQYTPPDQTPAAMGELIDWYRQEEKAKILHPIKLAALLHYRFVRIHPFDDGNGRISRLLVNYVMLRNGYPPVVIKSADKANYLHNLHLADTGDLDAFIGYIAEQTIWSLDLSIKAARGESIDEPGDLDKKIALLKKKMGENPDEQVKMTRSPQAIQGVIENCVVPLANAWEERLKDFDTFFYFRTNFVSVDLAKREGANIASATIEMIELVKIGLEKGMLPSSIILQTQPRGIRRLAKDISVKGGDITFFFQHHTYEVLWSGAKREINKLYHQYLTSEEINSIVDDLGTSLFKILEGMLGK